MQLVCLRVETFHDAAIAVIEILRANERRIIAITILVEDPRLLIICRERKAKEVTSGPSHASLADTLERLELGQLHDGVFIVLADGLEYVEGASRFFVSLRLCNLLQDC